MGIDLNRISAALGQSILVSDGTDTLAIDSSGNIGVNQSGTWTVAATQSGTWDIGSITNAVTIQDGGNTITVDGTIAATQSGTWDIGSITNAVTIQDGGNTITVDASNLDIRDLTHASDSVKIGDGTDFLAINTDGSLNVVANPGGFGTWQVAAVSVANTATQIGGTPLAGRLSCVIQNIGNQDMYVGPVNTVTTSSGLLIAKGFSQTIELDAGATIYGITSASTTDVRFAEFSA